MDFLISFLVALVIMLLVGVVSQGWYKFSRRNKMPEGWRESETQRMLRESQEKEQWESNLQATHDQAEKVSSAVVIMHHKLSH